MRVIVSKIKYEMWLYVGSLLAIQKTRFYITINIQTPSTSMINIIRCPAMTKA